MVARLGIRWQKIKQHRGAIGVVATVLIVAIALIIALVWFNGTGFNGYNKITVAHTISGTNTGTVIRTEEYQPGKTLWDLLQLLIIPAVLAGAGYVINLTISRGEQAATEQRAKSEREAAEKRAENEREVALDNQREAALKDYIDKMSELLLHGKLRESAELDEIVTIAQVRTLTVLPRLDAKRKAIVLQFLYKSWLIHKTIHKTDGIINLRSANLSFADLDSVVLSNINLDGANLVRAKLSFANLNSASLSGTILYRANLFGAVLRGADLRGAFLRGANLSLADLRFADLSKTNIEQVLLRDFNMTLDDIRSLADEREGDMEADLIDADLSGANLKGAKVTDEQLTKAKSLKGATMPDGSIHP